jgi:hypothetical protein
MKIEKIQQQFFPEEKILAPALDFSTFFVRVKNLALFTTGN